MRAVKVNTDIFPLLSATLNGCQFAVQWFILRKFPYFSDDIGTRGLNLRFPPALIQYSLFQLWSYSHDSFATGCLKFYSHVTREVCGCFDARSAVNSFLIDLPNLFPPNKTIYWKMPSTTINSSMWYLFYSTHTHAHTDIWPIIAIKP